MNITKISGLLRQIEQIKKTEYMTDAYKAACISEIQKQINEIAGQGSLQFEAGKEKPDDKQTPAGLKSPKA